MAKNILIIDDEEILRFNFRRALESTGHEIDTVASGEEGIQKAKEKKPDLVFLDLLMPGMDGIQTMYELLKIAPDLPIYIVTAFHSHYTENLRIAAQYGAKFKMCQKPVRLEHLRRIVKEELDTNVDN